MTEKQGGTDVRANATKAAPAGNGGPGAEYIITGHKWFMSAPMCDAFLVLAQAPGGLSCFLMPRFLPDGTVNALRFQRLKDKLGNRSNASSEVEFQAAHAWLIGEEGRGVPTIIEMVTRTRLDCAVGSAGLMRLALANAIHHCRHRTVFQKPLVDQPLMQQVLADLALDVEAATALSFRLARSFDRASDAHAAAWRRLMTPVTKYWVCKIGPALAYEAMECLGGNGYVEEAPARAASIASCRSTPSGRAPATSWRSTCCACCSASPRRSRSSWTIWARPSADDAHLKAHGAHAGSAARAAAARSRAGASWPRRWRCWRPARSCRAHAPAAVADAFIATRLRRRVAPDLRPGTRVRRHPRHRRARLAEPRVTRSP